MTVFKCDDCDEDEVREPCYIDVGDEDDIDEPLYCPYSKSRAIWKLIKDNTKFIANGDFEV